MIESAYFGWQQLAHHDGCTTPNPALWEPDIRREQGAHPLPHRPDLQHKCVNPNCDHQALFTRVTVRAICRTCGAAHLICGEGLTQEQTTTEAIGYGRPPREVAGLYLYPDEPVLFGEGPGRSGHDDQPRSYLTTTALVDRLTLQDCVGAIGRHPTGRGPELWWARAISVPLPGRLDAVEHGLNWARRASELPSLDAAAEWIATAIANTRLEVHV